MKKFSSADLGPLVIPYEIFLGALGGRLESLLGLDVGMELLSIELRPLEDDGKVLAPFSISGSCDPGFIGVEPALLFAVYDRLLGGTARRSQLSRRPNKLERSFLAYLSSEILKLLGETWASFGELKVKIAEMEKPSVEKAVYGNFLLWETSLQAGGARGSLIVAVPPSVGRGLIPALKESNEAPPFSGDKQMELIGETETCLEVELGTGALSAAELESLRPGDLLVLERRVDDELEVLGEGGISLRGRPVVIGGALSFLTTVVKHHDRN
ncbi:MAG: FliM/FliN family flagellar motor switch protein [bacterium]